jgi:protein phosphatase
MIQHSSNWNHCLDYAALSDVGLRRSNNQDSYTVLLASNQDSWNRRGHVFLVADGMGAHAAGEYASKLAVDNIPHTYHKLPDESPASAIRKAIEEVNHIIHQRGQANVEFQGMGTTSSALLLVPQGALVAHVGDSRVYRLRGNRLEQLSFDHSLVWELMASGQLKDDVPSYIPKNIITRSLGPNAEVKVDIEGPFPVAVGDTFLLCSDGLSGQVQNEEMAAILGALSPEEAARALVDLANLRGGPDNITVIVVRVTGPQVAGPGEASDSSEFPHGRPRLSPLWWGLVVLLAAVSGGLFLGGHMMPALGAALLTVLAAVALALLLGRGGSQESDVSEVQFGRAPYATAVSAANQAFVRELAKILDQVRDAAAHGDWVVDWSKVDSTTAAAVEAVKTGNYATAVREYCRAISLLMQELRNQRRKT